jgi:glutathione S-transferase
MTTATLTITSRNYGAWSLRSWLLCRLAELEFTEQVQENNDPSTRAELLLLSPSFLVPRLEHDGITVWDTMAIAGYLEEQFPDAGMLPAEPQARAHCRSISGEMHTGFHGLRSALPMNVKRRFTDFKVWAGAQDDLDRIFTIWRGCLDTYGGPWLFGSKPTTADAMYAPVCCRIVTYGVECDKACAAYVDTVQAWAPVKDWVAAAEAEVDEVAELECEF